MDTSMKAANPSTLNFEVFQSFLELIKIYLLIYIITFF